MIFLSLKAKGMMKKAIYIPWTVLREYEKLHTDVFKQNKSIES